jgi:hypothetical protein
MNGTKVNRENSFTSFEMEAGINRSGELAGFSLKSSSVKAKLRFLLPYAL